MALMKINKFTNNAFGTLTTITSPTGLTLFVAQEVAEMWGHTNFRRAIRVTCNKDEYKVLKLKKFKKFKEQLLANGLIKNAQAPSITMLTESAMWKLVLSSNLKKAIPFRDWVTAEVLPSIREKGYYSIADQTQAMMIHSDTNIQKQNSKDINKKNFITAGVEAIIDYNRTSFILHTGTSPSKMKEYGKSIGLNSKQTASGKEVLRNIDPGMACALSFTDSLTAKGFDLKTVSELSLKCALPLFNGMIEIGIRPHELK